MTFRTILLMWQFGLIDTFSAINFMYNLVAQYSSVVVAALAYGNITQFPKVMFEPITGLGVAYRFVKIAEAAEKQKRIATLALLLANSVSADAQPTPVGSSGMGVVVAAQIAHMKKVLETRGGSTETMNYILIESLKKFAMKTNPRTTPVVTPLLTPA